jgi:hypothetical protein
VLTTALQYRLAKLGLSTPPFLSEAGRRLDDVAVEPVSGPRTP